MIQFWDRDRCGYEKTPWDGCLWRENRKRALIFAYQRPWTCQYLIVSTSHRVCTMKNINFTDFFNVFLSGATIWGFRNFCITKAVHWYCTNKPPLRIWRAYFDSPLPFWYNLLLIVASKLWGRWTLEFSGNNFAAYFYWQLHICHRFSYTKSSWISLKK